MILRKATRDSRANISCLPMLSVEVPPIHKHFGASAMTFPSRIIAAGSRGSDLSLFRTDLR